MGEDEGFIRAIIANPSDEALRLIYADWLDEREDPRGEYLRLLTSLSGDSLPVDRQDVFLARLDELEAGIDPLWAALMYRGRTFNRRGQAREGRSRPRERRHREEVTEADIGIFLRQYARKAPHGGEPNDRGYSRKIEKKVKRMKPEELDRLIRGEEI